MKIKTGDTVLIITGKDKGKKGRVMKVMPESNKVIVEKQNIVTKHMKKGKDKPGQRIEKEAPIHASNVMVICPESGKPTRVKYEVPKSGKKYRVSLKSGVSLERPFVKS